MDKTNNLDIFMTDLADSIREATGETGSINAQSFSTRITGLGTGKQDKLVSGENIKTINGESLLGSGDIEIGGGRKEVNGNTLDTNNIILKPNEIVSFSGLISYTDIVIAGFEETHYLEDGLFDTVTEYDEYFLQFTTIALDSNVSLTLPSYVRWANDEIPEIQDYASYELSITRQRVLNESYYKAVLTPFKPVE